MSRDVTVRITRNQHVRSRYLIFYIGKYEVTQRLWRAVMDTDSILPFNGGCEDCPMENVSWKNAQEFIGR
mgnify:CR=1 FL=1